MAKVKYTEEYDIDTVAYRNIFSDSSKPFSERLDLAVKYGNQVVKNKIDIMNTFYVFEQTGVIPIKSSNWINCEGGFVWYVQKDDGSPIANLMRLYHNINNPTKENIAQTKKRFDDMVDKKLNKNYKNQ